MIRTLLALVFTSVAALSAAAQAVKPSCPDSTRGSERCERLAMDHARAALDRTVGRVVEILPDSLRRGFLALSAQWEAYRRLECERLNASFEGGTIAGPAYAGCITRLSNERAVFLADAYELDAVDREAHGGCLGYEPDTVTLTGHLSRRTYPGRPNFESVTSGDEPETGFYLSVKQPICVTRNLDDVNRPTAGVRLVQLVLARAGYDGLRPSLDRSVTVRGTLFHSHTGHHHAELLLQVVAPAR